MTKRSRTTTRKLHKSTRAKKAATPKAKSQKKNAETRWSGKAMKKKTPAGKSLAGKRPRDIASPFASQPKPSPSQAKAARAITTPSPSRAKPSRAIKTTSVSKPLAQPIEATYCRLRLPLHVMSDSTGNLAQHMLTAFLTQFPEDAFSLRRHNFLQTEQALRQAMEIVTQAGGAVMHAFVSPRFKKITEEICQQAKIPCCDLTGQLVEFLWHQSGVQPVPNLRRLHDTSAEYHQRIKALEFTLEHDDGLGLETLHGADIVLAGVSRTSKTPTSIYLAQQGYNVANVSLALEVQPPAALLAMNRQRVVGLVIDPNQLVEIRTNRQVSWRMSDTSYNSTDHVAREVAWCRQLFNRQGWHVLDVTDQAVEETAGRIVDLLQVRRPHLREQKD